MNRREIIKSSIALAGVSTLSSIVQAKSNDESSKSMFSDEELSYIIKHGQPKNDIIFFQSVCNVSKANAIRSEINSMFERASYKTQLTYSSNDRYKSELGHAIVDYISSNQNIEISVISIVSIAKLTGMKPTDYTNLVASITKQCLNGGEFSQTLSFKSEGGFGYSNFQKESIERVTGKRVQYIDAKQDRLMQALDFVTGCICADMSNFNIESSVKLNLINKSRIAFGNVEKFTIDSKFGNVTTRQIKI